MTKDKLEAGMIDPHCSEADCPGCAKCKSPNNKNGFPCIGCGILTGHGSGKCKECRMQKCAKAGCTLRFTPRRNQPRYCQVHHRVEKQSAWDEPVMEV
jgi:hypothetical protein